MKKTANITKRLLQLLVLFQLLLTADQALAQNLTIKGRVLKDDGQPAQSASVLLKGTNTGTTTNQNGEFTLSAPSNGTLIISTVDFITQEVAVNGSATMSVTLVSATRSLGEVVVVGYGTQRKRDVTGSTITVKGETLNQIKAPNLFNQLQGRAAGVDIVNNSSQIGAGGEIRIRGNRSITGNNNPLIVVDGMAFGGSVNDINPENIATVDILKDASATAIFGSRGSNGVIIITTKHGRTGKPVTTYNGYVGISSAIDTWEQFNGQEYAKYKEDARQGQPAFLTNPNVTSPYALTAIEQTNLAAGVNTNWQDLLLTTGIRTGHDLNVAGGNDRTQYFFGFGYFRETGIIPDQALDRYTLNVNIDHKMTERIRIGFTSFNTMIYQKRLGPAHTARLCGLVRCINPTMTMVH